MSIRQLSAVDLRLRLMQPDPPLLLDVREPYEFRLAHIAGSVLVPLQQLTQRLNELPARREIVVICHHGMRSQQAAEYLAGLGYDRVANLKGGIDAWSLMCDVNIPRY